MPGGKKKKKKKVPYIIFALTGIQHKYNTDDFLKDVNCFGTGFIIVKILYDELCMWILLYRNNSLVQNSTNIFSQILKNRFLM